MLLECSENPNQFFDAVDVDELPEETVDNEFVTQVAPKLNHRKTNDISKELVEQYQAGSKKAEKELFTIIQQFVFAYLSQSLHGRTKSYLKLLAHESLEDVEQDIAIVCLHALKNYKPKSNAKVTTFLMSAIMRRLITRNILANNFVRKVHSNTESFVQIDQEFDTSDENKSVKHQFSDLTYEPTVFLEMLEESKLLQTFTEMTKDDPWVVEVFTEKKSLSKVAKKYNIDLKDANNILKYYLNQIRIVAFNKKSSHPSLQKILKTATKDDPWVVDVLTGKQTIQVAAKTENLTIKNARSIVHYYIEHLKNDFPGLDSLSY